jgi:hypothetical protein
MSTPIPPELQAHFGPATVVSRLLLAAVLSGVVGWERERLRKPAGFRTHILVGVGSCLIMLVSLYVPVVCPWTNVDPGRIAAQVVVGIGFLGAGTILHNRSGVVSGLTTAASLWVVAGLGLAVGIGFHLAAVVAGVLVMVVLLALNHFDDYIEQNLYQRSPSGGWGCGSSRRSSSPPRARSGRCSSTSGPRGSPAGNRSRGPSAVSAASAKCFFSPETTPSAVCRWLGLNGQRLTANGAFEGFS